ncbi:hypothetical protein LTR56_009717 [Elasticomyces elasticus]|nr:hypothetical protein LTR22_025075 [Elasticomyces elasticus]KAK3644180.1 hypothetical protein LTR56_009717 [Elasticomyces elasticus]KAK4919137.1 hypothetical protein LTR49_013141 [Elasticomyces elasticus]KAK5741806.1 hypothetical protein LTS12_024483 [Elasticomyces elasticus]
MESSHDDCVSNGYPDHSMLTAVSDSRSASTDLGVMEASALDNGEEESRPDQESKREGESIEQGDQKQTDCKTLKGRCYFLELPKEMRLQIYELLSPRRVQLRTYDKPTMSGLSARDIASKRIYRRRNHAGTDSTDEHFHVELLHTCYQVNEEAKLILRQPRHIFINPSTGGTYAEDKEAKARYTCMPDIRMLRSLTVSFVTTLKTAAEDLLQSQSAIAILRDGLRVQQLPLLLEASWPASDSDLPEAILASLEATVAVWLEARIGVNISILVEDMSGQEVSWKRPSGGEWHQLGLDNTHISDADRTFCDSMFKTIKAASTPSAVQ